LQGSRRLPEIDWVQCLVAALVAQMIKNLSATWETWVWSLGWEDPLEKGMATHSSILAWRIPWTEEPGGLQSMGSQRAGHDWSDLVRSTHNFEFFMSHLKNSILRKANARTSLAVQWLRLHASTAGSTNLILGWGIKILQPEKEKEKQMLTSVLRYTQP